MAEDILYEDNEKKTKFNVSLKILNTLHDWLNSADRCSAIHDWEGCKEALLQAFKEVDSHLTDKERKKAIDLKSSVDKEYIQFNNHKKHSIYTTRPIISKLPSLLLNWELFIRRLATKHGMLIVDKKGMEDALNKL